MSKDTLYISKKDFLFFMAFWMFLTCQFFSSTLFSKWLDFNTIRLIMFFCVSLLLGVKFLIDRNYKHSGWFLAVIILSISIGLRAENLRDLILIALFLLESRNVDFKKIARFYCCIIFIPVRRYV